MCCSCLEVDSVVFYSLVLGAGTRGQGLDPDVII